MKSISLSRLSSKDHTTMWETRLIGPTPMTKTVNPQKIKRFPKAYSNKLSVGDVFYLQRDYFFYGQEKFCTTI
jgi:hypothetical protein